jgi:hypothetical protein
MTEAVIHTQFGEIHITYQNIDELKNTLQDLDQQMEHIRAIADKIAPPQPRTPKPGYESYYRFTSAGSVELLNIPQKQNEAVALLLYAYHPDATSSTEIEKATGIDDVARRVLSQKAYETLFRKVDDKYGLTFAGIQMVQERFGQEIVEPSDE